MAIDHEASPLASKLASVVTGPSTASSKRPTVARQLSPLLELLFSGGIPVRVVFWDGSALGPEEGPGTVILWSARALTRLIWAPDELGLVRGFICGDIDLDGQLFELLQLLHQATSAKRRLGPRALASGILAALRLGAVKRPPPRPAEELRLRGRRHSVRRDAAAISHHYDVSNDFYRLVLGPAMTYSCARFARGDLSLTDAQASKHDLICKKLGLEEPPGARLLDVGCGWGSMAMYAAAQYGAQVLAITISPAQAELARARVLDANLQDRVEVRLQDYRELKGERFDAIASIGMFEHVGAKHMDDYFQTLFGLLEPTGRLLNHAISTPGGSKVHGRTFVNRYVFPDGELIDLASVVSAMERAGFEVRDVESLREHYRATLRAWVENLEVTWDEATHLVGEARSRIWRLYMAASANGFEQGGLAIHQVLGVRPDEAGNSAMPATRARWG